MHAADAWTHFSDEAHEAPTRQKSRPPGLERRVARRLPIELDVTVEGAACRFVTTSADVSPGGMFISTHEQIPIGTEVVLGFTLPGGTDLELIGTVQWRRGRLDLEAAQGFGVAFFCLDPEVRGILERFCSLREPLYYEDELDN
jgi:uncharacterized protein (TIGR02266 family)